MQLKNVIKEEQQRSFRKSYLNRINIGTTKYVLRLLENNKAYYGVRSHSRRSVVHNVVIGGTKDNLKLYCSCHSFLYQGFAYRNYINGSGYLRINIPDRVWRRHHGKALLCKHLLAILNLEQKNLNKFLK